MSTRGLIVLTHLTAFYGTECLVLDLKKDGVLFRSVDCESYYTSILMNGPYINKTRLLRFIELNLRLWPGNAGCSLFFTSASCVQGVFREYDGQNCVS
ncbi:hypothetical protein EDC04DRAFT_2772343 [Pisolithus marmoratus]|nr:hypothetical protein EDC04DRAFT_2772343 [Pisolithus marmoratus]